MWKYVVMWCLSYKLKLSYSSWEFGSALIENIYGILDKHNMKDNSFWFCDRINYGQV